MRVVPALLVFCSTAAAQPLVHRIAGPGPNDRIVMDDRPATSVGLWNAAASASNVRPINRTVAVTFDPAGRLLFATSWSIMRVYEDGLLKVIAGGNGPGIGIAGDEVASTSALITQLAGQIAVDTTGTIYFADTFDETVRMIKRDGLVRTVAHVRGVAGVLVDGAGRLYALGGNLMRVFPNGFTLSLGRSAYIAAAAPDSASDIYIVDSGIQRISADGRTLSTTRPPFGVSGIAVDGAGHIYVSDAQNNQIWRFQEGGTGQVIAGIPPRPGTPPGGYEGDGGPALSARFAQPASLALDRSGALYIADTGNDVIRKITPDGTVSTVAGNGPVPYVFPKCVTDFTTQLNGSADVFTRDGEFGTTGLLFGPRTIAFGADSSLLIGTLLRIRKLNAGGVISTVAGNGTLCPDPDSKDARSVAVPDEVITTDREGSIYATGFSDPRIRRIDADGKITTIAGVPNPIFLDPSNVPDGPALQAKFGDPRQLAVDSKHNVYVVDSVYRVRVITPDGFVRTIAGGAPALTGNAIPPDGTRALDVRWNLATGVAVGRDDRVYISGSFGAAGVVFRIESDGTVHRIAGGGASNPDEVSASDANLPAIRSLSYDSTTDDLYLNADDRVWQITNDNVIHWIAGTGRRPIVLNPSGQGLPLRETDLTAPFAIPRPDALYISDPVAAAVFRVYPTPPFVNVTTGYQLNLTASAGSPIAQAAVEVLSTALLPYSVQATAEDGSRWLRADVYEGNLPARFLVIADASNLKPGAYAGSVHITAPGSLPPVQTIRVTLTVNK